MEKKTMGQFITVLRKANGMTQKDLAEKLNVSDKSVSRWERDETAPDLTIIPVIAEIFGVTSDELLRGERAKTEKAQSATQDETVFSVKSEKLVKKIATDTKNKYNSGCVFSVAIAIIGYLLALFCNFYGFEHEPNSGDGFFIGTIFYVVAIACQIVICIKYFVLLSAEEFADFDTKNYRKKMYHTAEIVFACIGILFALTLPLICQMDGEWSSLEIVIYEELIGLSRFYVVRAVGILIVLHILSELFVVKKKYE